MSDIIRAAQAPKPIGAYPHARRVGNLLFLSGIGSIPVEILEQWRCYRRIGFDFWSWA